MICNYCQKTIRYDTKVFYIYGKPHHLACVPKVIRLEKKKAKRVREEKEQKTLVGWNC